MVLPGGHAYSVIGAFKTEDDPPRYYFRMRNPWGDDGSRKTGIRYKKDSKGRESMQLEYMEDGVFDLEVKDFVKYYNALSFNGSVELIEEPHLRTEGYDIITTEQRRQHEERIVDKDGFDEYDRAAKDIYAALLGTDSIFSRDSRQYKELKESVQAFRDGLIANRGMDMNVLKQAAENLQTKAQAYMDHVPQSPSSRQQARTNVCKTIMTVTLAAQAGSKEPLSEIKAQFARNLMTTNFTAQKKPVPENLDELADKLVENRVFNTVTNKLNINEMLNARNSTLKKSWNEMREVAKGKGVDTGLDLNTMKTKRYAVRV